VLGDAAVDEEFPAGDAVAVVRRQEHAGLGKIVPALPCD
jgi:hypothetical protein